MDDDALQTLLARRLLAEAHVAAATAAARMPKPSGSVIAGPWHVDPGGMAPKCSQPKEALLKVAGKKGRQPALTAPRSASR